VPMNRSLTNNNPAAATPTHQQQGAHANQPSAFKDRLTVGHSKLGANSFSIPAS
jgi:hypothetical protein